MQAAATSSGGAGTTAMACCKSPGEPGALELDMQHYRRLAAILLELLISRPGVRWCQISKRPAPAATWHSCLACTRACRACAAAWLQTLHA